MMQFDVAQGKADYDENAQPQLLADGWYAPVRVTGAEQVRSQEKKSYGLKVQLRFTKPDGKPFQRTFSIWYANAKGEQNGFARLVYALAKATDAIYQEGDKQAIDEVSMVGKYVAVRLRTEEANGDYQAKNGLSAVKAYSQTGTAVFAGDVKALDADEGARATATMQAQADQQVATQAAQAAPAQGQDFNDPIPAAFGSPDDDGSDSPF